MKKYTLLLNIQHRPTIVWKKKCEYTKKKNLFPFKCAMYISIDIIFRYICCGLSSHYFFFFLEFFWLFYNGNANIRVNLLLVPISCKNIAARKYTTLSCIKTSTILYRRFFLGNIHSDKDLLDVNCNWSHLCMIVTSYSY